MTIRYIWLYLGPIIFYGHTLGIGCPWIARFCYIAYKYTFSIKQIKLMNAR